MPYKDAELAKIKAKERKRKQRMSHPSENTMSHPVTPDKMSHPVTPEQENDVTPIKDIKPTDDYPPIVHYLADDTKREKLRRISDSLSNHNVSELVRFGCFGPTFDKIGEILTAFPVNKRLYDSCYGV